jgi:predicted outer membrane protein
MLRRIPRLLRGAVIVAMLVAVSASVYQSWATGAPGMLGWQQTQWGPLGPADRDLIEKVRMANLWEGPTSQQAEQMASGADVREVGRKLATEHAQLDEETRKVAGELGVPLPNGPSSQQMGWMSEISSKTGSDYDRTFVQRVREAHAQVLPVISEVRATTQNDLVRQFAITSAEFVNRHHEYLESTGLVDYAALPHHGPGLFGGGTAMSDLLVPFLVFIAALLAAAALFWGLRNRGTPANRRRITVADPPISPPAARFPELTAVAAIPAPRSVGLDDTGPIPVISDVPLAELSDSGAYQLSPDTTSRGYRSARRRAADVETDTGSDHAVTDSDSHRSVSTSGSHRMPRSRRARHSMRR